MWTLMSGEAAKPLAALHLQTIGIRLSDAALGEISVGPPSRAAHYRRERVARHDCHQMRWLQRKDITPERGATTNEAGIAGIPAQTAATLLASSSAKRCSFRGVRPAFATVLTDMPSGHTPCRAAAAGPVRTPAFARSLAACGPQIPRARILWTWRCARSI